MKFNEIKVKPKNIKAPAGKYILYSDYTDRDGGGKSRKILSDLTIVTAIKLHSMFKDALNIQDPVASRMAVDEVFDEVVDEKFSQLGYIPAAMLTKIAASPKLIRPAKEFLAKRRDHLIVQYEDIIAVFARDLASAKKHMNRIFG